MTDSDVVQLITRIRERSSEADTARLFSLVYDELRANARGLMKRERVGHTLQATALVNEAYLKLVGSETPRWEDRSHFIGTASRAMRQILVDHARSRKTDKRGGDWSQVTLAEELVGGTAGVDVLELDRALTQLESLDSRASRVAELRLIGGLKIAEVAEVLGVSKRTVDGDWTMARMWLAQNLGPGTSAD